MPTIPKPTLTAPAIVALLLGVVLLARHALDDRQPSPVAWAIMSGKAQARAIATDDGRDSDLVGDEAAAGAMWARSHRATDPDECPLYPPALRRGCGAYLAAHGQ